MFEPVQPDAIAWQPLTPRGIAAFGGASWRRLLLVQLIVAIVAAVTLSWIVEEDCYPAIKSAIHQLPEEGQIRNGQLEWTGKPSEVLASGNLLSISVDLDHTGAVRSPAQVQVELGRTEIQLHSALGYYTPIIYPRNYTIPLNRLRLEPWWGAWSPILLGTIAVMSVVGLMLTWMAMATVYAPVLWLVGLFTNRLLGPLQSWKIAGALLMPGALLQIAVLVGYGLGRLDLVQLCAGTAVHLLVGWLLVFLVPLYRPRQASPEKIKGNPFEPEPPSSVPSRQENPFSGR